MTDKEFNRMYEGNDLDFDLTQEEMDCINNRFKYFYRDVKTYALAILGLFVAVILEWHKGFNFINILLIIALIIIVWIFIDSILSIKRAKKNLNSGNYELYEADIIGVDKESGLVRLYIAYTSFGVRFDGYIWITKEDYAKLKFDTKVIVLCVSSTYHLFVESDMDFRFKGRAISN